MVKSVRRNHEKIAAFGEDFKVKNVREKKKMIAQKLFCSNLTKNVRTSKIKLEKIFKILFAKLNHSIPKSLQVSFTKNWRRFFFGAWCRAPDAALLLLSTQNSIQIKLPYRPIE